MMYDELVERLRADKISLDELTIILEKAANAIVDLEQENEKLRNELSKAIRKLAERRWIPVTERLPESGIHVLACCRVKWLNGNGRSYVCDAFYSAPKTEVCSYNDEIDAEYDEETDEYYMPEGWWEVIKNWDDYSCVAIADFVTHWMPLPEPPESEGE